MSVLQQYLLLQGMVALLMVLHTAGCLAVCWALRIRIDQIELFLGKTIATFPTPLGRVVVGIVPVGASVRVADEGLAKHSLPSRILLTCSGTMLTLAAAMVILPLDQVVPQFVSAFPQIIQGSLEPFDQGVPLVRAFFAKASESVVIAFGILAVKQAAMNCFPWPGSAGGQLLMQFRKSPVMLGALERTWMILGALLGFAMIGCWWIASGGYFWQQLSHP